MVNKKQSVTPTSNSGDNNNVITILEIILITLAIYHIYLVTI